MSETLETLESRLNAAEAKIVELIEYNKALKIFMFNFKENWYVRDANKYIESGYDKFFGCEEFIYDEILYDETNKAVYKEKPNKPSCFNRFFKNNSEPEFTSLSD